MLDQRKLQQETNEKFQRWQSSTPFPWANYHPQFRKWLDRAMLFTCPAAIKMSISDWIAITEKETKDFSLWDMGALLHIMESRTAQDMIMTLKAFNEYQRQIELIVIEWRNIVAPKQKELQEEAQKIMQEAQEEEKEKESKIIPLGQPVEV